MPTNPFVVVSTLAGSGAAGFADGPAAQASFVMPFGVAYAPDGTLYVSDAGAQRIRAVDPAGHVRTIAGGGELTAKGLWVTGGYRDGTGAEARFDRPAGIAWQNGALYVADTYNHCIRKVTPSGVVTTFAGSPTHVGYADGTLATATFTHPVGLAFDANGVLYVADPGSGLRTIAKDGTVGRISELGGGTPYGVAATSSPDGVVLFVADLLGLVRRAPDGTLQRFSGPEAPQIPRRQTQGLEPIGYPFALAAFDRDAIVYTDVRGSSVRYMNWDAAAPQVLAGADVLDGAASAAGFRNGRGNDALVDVPMGVTIDRAGNVVVADSGSRRIRLITHFDRSHDAHTEPQRAMVELAPRPGAYRIAFIGSSFIYTYLRWDDSIPGVFESALAPDFASMQRRSGARFRLSRCERARAGVVRDRIGRQRPAESDRSRSTSARTFRGRSPDFRRRSSDAAGRCGHPSLEARARSEPARDE